MSKKKGITDNEFARQLGRSVIGAIILIVLLVIWLLWDKIWNWFYHVLFPSAPKGTLLMFWLLILFPLLTMGIVFTVDGGIKAYKIASPPKKEE
ncbi:MAG: hypothetical protein ACTSYD_00130 [Candidatus Heimdallarchaeaceae archaeon]